MKAIASYGWLAAVVVGYCTLGPAVSLAEDAERAPDAKGVEFFEKHIRPVLTQQCYKCHAQTSTKIKGELLLDTRDGSRMGGESGPAVVPGSVEDSLLINALRHDGFEMPPGNKLPDDVIAKFEQWIKMGAPDPRDGQAVIAGKRDINIEEGRKFWAFQPPQKAAPPAVKNAAWPREDVDRFVLAKLEDQSLSPAADASPRELVRRLYFDLIGLPPSAEEIEKWTERLTKGSGVDQAALAQLVDELLATPRFGERWGRHWLDVARYADSNGNADNVPFPEAWRYRDWVIDALNDDMPYDRFLVEQIAGDLLPHDSPAQRNAQVIATGLLAIGSKPRAQNNPNYAMDVVAEQIEVVTSSMLGLTVACARCHDHKFDPIPTSDYYALAGIFASSNSYYGTGVRDAPKNKGNKSGLIALVSEEQNPSADAQRSAAEHQRLAQRQIEIVAELKQLGFDVQKGAKNPKQAKQQAARQIEKQRRKLEERLAQAKAQGDQQKTRSLEKQLAQLQPVASDKTKRDGAADRISPLRDELAQVEAKLAEVAAKLPGVGNAMGVLDGAPTDCAICIGGESTDRGPVVKRGLVSVITPASVSPTIAADGSGRLQLAEWIASAENPLTARVMANRVWQHLMGRGIVQSVDNFGSLGEAPTHAELLDHLAVRLVEHEWSIKKLIREIVLTRVYQLSSAHHDGNYAADPDNRWLWRSTPQRLDAEALRDAMLAFSGKLDLQRPRSAGAVQVGRQKNAPETASAGNYRSVYLPVVRNGEPEPLMLFDFADPSIVVGRREETTVPSQSLYMLNSPLVLEQSRAAAQRLLERDAETMSDAERVDYAYLLAFSRPPTNEQRDRALAFLAEAKSDKDAQDRSAAWAALCQSLIASAEFRYLD